MAKMVLYKTIAEGGKRAGRTMYCVRCSNPYTDNISEDALGVVCCKCSNGMADGLVVEKPKKTKRAVNISVLILSAAKKSPLIFKE